MKGIVDLFFSGWGPKVLQNEIAANMYYPLKWMIWRMEDVVENFSWEDIDFITDSTQKLIAYYEELVLRSLCMTLSKKGKKKDDGSDTKDMEKMISGMDMEKVLKLRTGGEDESVSPIKEFHEDMSTVKGRLDVMIDNYTKGVTTSQTKIFAFVTDIRNFHEFVCRSMSVAKELSPDLNGIKKSVELGVVPQMAERHVPSPPRMTALKRRTNKKSPTTEIEEGEGVPEIEGF